MSNLPLDSKFLQYLADHPVDAENGLEAEQLPAMSKLSEEIGVSVPLLREQLEVARALGLVEVRPRTGIKRLPYSFSPAVRQSLFYALQRNPSHFDQFSDLRNHLEMAYWHKAVRCLTPEDKAELTRLVDCAWAKLRGSPIQIPHAEHRQFHLGIYRSLENPFVFGLLETYWDAYEAVGLNVYADYGYLQQVWRFHQEMLDSITSGSFESGFKAMVEHNDLLFQLKSSVFSHNSHG